MTERLNIYELGRQRNEIMAAQDIDCPECGGHQYAPFGKLYVRYVGKCQDCTLDVAELTRHGTVIMQIIEGL